MARFQPFQPTECPLEGTNLVEAGAGTGKTYAITGLYLRLLIEKKLSVNEILVVTFTEAATAELKERIRKRLREALRWLDDHADSDPLYEALLQRVDDPREIRYRLRQALRNFDETAIFTIHGFCARLLSDHPFESGSRLEVEVSADERLLSREVVCDYWRKQLEGMSPLFADYLIGEQIGLETLQQIIEPMLRNPNAAVVPSAVEEPDCGPQEDHFHRLYLESAKEWERYRDEAADILLHSPSLNRRKYGKKKMVDLINQLDVYLRSQRASLAVPADANRLSRESLAGGVKQGFDPPQHSFFECFDDLLTAREGLETVYRQRLLALKVGLFGFVRQELRERKEEARIRFFADLLLDVKSALDGKQSQDFLRAVGRRYKAALIDEFQDTDPVQYEIFQRLFATGGGALYLIGDPKQAIYGFRGADIFAYFQASRQAQQRYTLERNWRSEPGLIEACNRIFSRSSLPFVYQEIEFRPAMAAPKQGQRLRFAGARRPPLQLWFINASALGKDKPLNKAEAQTAVVKAVTAEISKLIDAGHRGTVTVGDQPLRERDIAVLVRTSREAQAVHEQLRQLGIPGIIYKSGNLFESLEAEEMEYFLRAVLESGDQGLVRTCLSTGPYGLNGRQLAELTEGSGHWEAYLDRFRTYHELWVNRGFMTMFREWLLQEKVLKQLASYPDGERRITNLLHLAELLNERSLANNAGPVRLVKWLADMRGRPDIAEEEHLLRLETDEAAVRIVTIHKSKGLEYPVVFCPFNWNHFLAQKEKDPFIVCHQLGNAMELLIDLGSPQWEEHLFLSKKEGLAEDLRLLYVALTRARHRCYLVSGEVSGAPCSAPAYLLHDLAGDRSDESSEAVPGVQEPSVDLFQRLASNYNRLSTEQRWRQLSDMAEQSNDTIALDLLPEKTPLPTEKKIVEQEPLRRPSFTADIRCGWRISSYSSLTSQREQEFDEPERDSPTSAYPWTEERAAEQVLDSNRGLFSFPRGPEAGIVLHDILEQVDFEADMDDEETRELVRKKLTCRGFDPVWTDSVCTMLREVVRVPLPAGSPLRLAEVGRDNRLSELEFHFPLAMNFSEKLSELVSKHCRSLSGETQPEIPQGPAATPGRGFMKGFIDLVFRHSGKYYLIDWKSNFLGSTPDDYHKSRLVRTMIDDQYVFQYLLYTLAVHEFLSLRLAGYHYEKHFGGVFYLFLRGLNETAGPDYGIFFDRPPFSLVDRLRRLLIPQTPSERLLL